MKLRAEDLASHLSQKLAPVYIVSGDEPLQVGEAADAIRARAREMGFSERQVFSVERGFDWGNLYAASNTLSLFAEKTLIELRFASAKPGDDGAKALREYAASPSPDNLLIISLPKLDKATQNSKWFTELEKVGVFIQIWPVDSVRLGQWVAQRMRRKGLKPTPEAAEFLADRVEGNLLAAAQEIDKLCLTHSGEVGLEAMMEAVADSARFDVYTLVDAALSGDAVRTARILGVLRDTGVEPMIVQWALSREIRSLAEMAAERGTNIDAVIQKHRVWKNRVPLVKQALQRIRPGQWNRLLLNAGKIDRMIKGLSSGNCWNELLKLSLAMGGTELLREI